MTEPKLVTFLQPWLRELLAQPLTTPEKLLELIGRHEGFRATCYHDTRGRLTIGYGFNLDAIGASAHCRAAGVDYVGLRSGAELSEPQAKALMAAAAEHASDTACIVVRGFAGMAEAVKLAIPDMIYNLGAAGFVEFVHLRAALEAGNWEAAAAAMQDSTWYHQVGTRADDDIALVLSAYGAG